MHPLRLALLLAPGVGIVSVLDAVRREPIPELDKVGEFNAIASDPEIQNTSVSDPEIQDTTASDPEVQDTTVPDPEIQDTTASDPEIQDTTASDPEIQDTIASDPEVQDTTVPDPEVQDTTASDPEIQDTTGSDPEIEGFSCKSDPLRCLYHVLPGSLRRVIAMGNKLIRYDKADRTHWWSALPSYYKQASVGLKNEFAYRGDEIVLLDFKANTRALQDFVERPAAGQDGKLRIAGISLKGRIHRENELGDLRLSNAGQFYERFKGIGLGAPDKIHDSIRPYLDKVYGTLQSEFEGGITKGFSGKGDGRFWSEHGLYESAKSKLATSQKLSYTKMYCYWTIEELHKVIGIDAAILRSSATNISDPAEYAKKVCGMQTSFLYLSLAPRLFAGLIAKFVGARVSMGELRKWRRSVQNDYKKALLGRIVPEGNQQLLDDVAAAILEAHLFAGGLSVPSVIASCIAHLYKNGGKDATFPMSSGSAKGKIDTDFSITDFVWEVLRVMSPVHYVPMWYMNGSGKRKKFWLWRYLSYPFSKKPRKRRVILCTACAQFDPAIWNKSSEVSPIDFAIRERNDYEKYSLGWADAAHNSQRPERDRWCPGKRLSLSLSVAWLKAYMEVMDEWELSLPKGKFTPTFMSPYVGAFFLIKKKQ